MVSKILIWIINWLRLDLGLYLKILNDIQSPKGLILTVGFLRTGKSPLWIHLK